MWVEATCFNGTTYSHESFIDEIVKKEDVNEVEKIAKDLIDELP